MPGPATLLSSGKGWLVLSSPNPKAAHLPLGLTLPSSSGPGESDTLSFLAGQVTDSYHSPSHWEHKESAS